MLDLALPGLNGLELQQALEQQASPLPIIFLTGRGDIASSVQAMKHGAADFLTKPVDDTDLIAAIHEALARTRRCVSALGASARREVPVIAHRARTASARADRRRKLNKQIAAELGTSEKTIKFHRGNLMRKMGVRVVADLVKLAERAGVGSAPGPELALQRAVRL